MSCSHLTVLALKCGKETHSLVQQSPSTLFLQMERGDIDYLQEICEAFPKFAQLRNMSN